MPRGVGDLTGKVFGELTVLAFDSQDAHYQKKWKCQCSCGNEVTVRQQHLFSGHTRSCGCMKPQLDDYTGRRFGHLVVLGRDTDYVCPGNGKHYVRYRCECDCGKQFTAIAANLKTGTTTSCGCKKQVGVFDDLSGQKFDKLTVIRRVDDMVNKSGRHLVQYERQCDCGNYILALANNLRKGEVGSCGCSVRSRGEQYVREWLSAHGIAYKLHKTFSNCRSRAGGKMSYDFWLPEYRALIECNGIQHYEPVEFFGGSDRYEEQVDNDRRKAEYANCCGYPYLVLDCRKIDTVVFDDLLSKFIDGMKC